MSYAPIVLFVYNRPDHVRNVIWSLVQNELAVKSEIFIYSDAAKGKEDEKYVQEVRNYINSINGFSKVHVIEREKNWGLARNIIDGVGNLISKYGKIIVLEDDLILSPYFLQFMNDALCVYENEDKVAHIHGCEFFNDTTLPYTFLIKWAGSWGWGTWEKSWRLFNEDGNLLLEELKNRRLTKTFDFNNAYGYTRMLQKQVEGKNNSWAIRWNASLFLKDKLSLNAGKSLVRNVGFDGSGTHCGDDNLYDSSLFMNRLQVNKIEPLNEDLYARKIIEDYYRRTNSFKAKLLRRLKKEINKL